MNNFPDHDELGNSEESAYSATRCPTCGGEIEFPVHGGGQEIECPICAGNLILPAQSEDELLQSEPNIATGTERGNHAMERLAAIRCPECRGKITVPRADLGRVAPCPHCQSKIELAPHWSRRLVWPGGLLALVTVVTVNSVWPSVNPGRELEVILLSAFAFLVLFALVALLCFLIRISKVAFSCVLAAILVFLLGGGALFRWHQLDRAQQYEAFQAEQQQRAAALAAQNEAAQRQIEQAEAQFQQQMALLQEQIEELRQGNDTLSQALIAQNRANQQRSYADSQADQRRSELNRAAREANRIRAIQAAEAQRANQFALQQQQMEQQRAQMEYERLRAQQEANRIAYEAAVAQWQAQQEANRIAYQQWLAQQQEALRRSGWVQMGNAYWNVR